MPGQPYFGPPPRWVPDKKPIWKRTWFRVVAVLFVLGAVNSATGDDDKTQETGTAQAADVPAIADAIGPTDTGVAEATPEPAPELAPPGIGQPAADGDFSFVVQGVDCGLTELGGEYFNSTAQGQFCVMSLIITNIGDSAQTFDGDNAILLNAEGHEFSADSGAAFHLEDSASFYEEINPGNTLKSKVVFDVPVGTNPTAIELHDSMFSGGVTVVLQ